jgi:hypothetical protein
MRPLGLKPRGGIRKQAIDAADAQPISIARPGRDRGRKIAVRVRDERRRLASIGKHDRDISRGGRPHADMGGARLDQLDAHREAAF